MRKFVITSLLALLCVQAAAVVRLPSVLSDGMVLQRNEPIRIWGWADSNEKFSVCWQDTCYPVAADKDGKWELTMPASEAGGPFTMTVGDIELKDILIGDVFLCSGQSNMELPVRRVLDMFADEVAEYENNSIRQYLSLIHISEPTRP